MATMASHRLRIFETLARTQNIHTEDDIFRAMVLVFLLFWCSLNGPSPICFNLQLIAERNPSRHGRFHDVCCIPAYGIPTMAYSTIPRLGSSP